MPLSRLQSAIGRWKYLRLAAPGVLFDIVEDPRERAALKVTHPERFARLKAEFSTWNATMLTYPEDRLSDPAKQNLPDWY